MREKTHILTLLKEKIPVSQGITGFSSYVSTIQNFISKTIVTSNEAIDEWVEIEDMDGEWDMMPEAERMVLKQKRMESQKTRNQIMRELLKKERQLWHEETLNTYSDADRSAFIGQSKAIDDLRPLFEESEKTSEEEKLTSFLD